MLLRHDDIGEAVVGKVVKALREMRQGRTDVDRDYRKGTVCVGKEIVAQWEGGRMRLRGEAKTLKSRIDELVNEKREKEEVSD